MKKMVIDSNEIMLNRKGKADGYIPSVRRGVGTHVSKKDKLKIKDAWKKEIKKYY